MLGRSYKRVEGDDYYVAQETTPYHLSFMFVFAQWPHAESLKIRPIVIGHVAMAISRAVKGDGQELVIQAF